MSIEAVAKRICVSAVLCVVFGQPALANICDAAAKRAAANSAVPADVMLAITRLETGQQGSGEPWPWTVNHAGDGTWFRSEDEARSYVFSRIKRGASNIDIGCFQINYRWHSNAFQSLDQMFDPDMNAEYAAGFLTELYDEFGDWTQAVGAYHSRTPEFATRYKAKFSELHAALQTRDFKGQLDEPPLTQAFSEGSSRHSGSLFLTSENAQRPFIDFRRQNR